MFVPTKITTFVKLQTIFKKKKDYTYNFKRGSLFFNQNTEGVNKCPKRQTPNYQQIIKRLALKREH